MKTSPLLALLLLLLFGREVSAQTAQPLITSGDMWKYLATGAAPGSPNWTGSGSFDETPWQQGISQLGYGNDGERTLIPYGPDPLKRYVTTYFRRTILLADASGTFSLRYKRDDGIVIYINGTELLREYMPAGVITNSTPAITIPEAEEPLWKTATVPATLLRAGSNVIAAEIHQASITSSDIRFDLELRRQTQDFQFPVTTSTSPVSSTFTSGAEWNYSVSSPTAYPAANWKSAFAPQFNDTSAPWFVGKSPLGYGAQGPVDPTTRTDKFVTDEGGTCVDQCASDPAAQPSCKTCPGRAITTYFRKTINLTNVPGSTFSMQYQRDDGIVIYINGQEVLREGFSATATIDYSTTATALPTPEEELVWKPVDPTKLATWLKEGQNLIAVEIHQNRSDGSDIRFNMELRQTPAASVSLERGPYLQRYSDDPNMVILPDKRSMTIRWSTSAAADGRVTYKTAAGSPVTTPWQPSKATVFSEGNPTARTIYDVSVTLNNLEADTPYSYTIQSGSLSQGDAANYFKTAPVIGSTKKTRMWVLGDFGKKPNADGTPGIDQIKVRDSFNNYVQANVADKYVDLWLWLGDNAYDWGRNWEYQQSVFDVYDGRKSASQRIMKQTPFFATPGNHDYRNNQDPGAVGRTNHGINHYFDVVNQMTAGDAAGEHSKKEEYYSFDHANIHFVSLDSYGYQKNPVTGVQETTVFPTGGVQLEWLKRDLALAQASPKIKWIVVFFHHPPYTMGSKNSDSDPELLNVRNRLVKDVLEKYRVDLVLTGHSHTYERSRPMNGHYDSSGTFSPTVHNAPVGNNGQSSGHYNGSSGQNPVVGQAKSVGSCFYYKSAADPKNHIVYVVNGSGGEVERVQLPTTAGVGSWPHKAMQAYYNMSGSMYIEVENDRLDAKFIDGDGLVKDQFTIVKDNNSFVIPTTDGTTRRAVCECTDAANWTHYTDLNANLLLSIKKNGNAIGTVGDGTFDLALQGRPGSTMLSEMSQPNDYVKAMTNVQNRYWTLKPTQEIAAGNPVSIRHYWKKGIDFGTFRNTYGGPYAAMYDYSYQTILINDDCSLPPVGYDRNPASSSSGGSGVFGHYAIPKAPAYTVNGAWVYKNGPAASSSTFKFGVLSSASVLYPGNMQAFSAEYSEFVVGRLKCIGGTIGGLFNPYDMTGNARIAAPLAEESTATPYPNPTLDGKVYFAPALPYQSFQLTDLQGKVLKRADQAGSLTQLDLSGLPAGLYVLVSQGEYGISRFKLIRN